MKVTVRDLDVKNKTVLLRVDFNLPMDDYQNIIDDKRVILELPTIKYLIENDAKVIICSHLGRPEGKRVEKYSLRPVCKHLSNLLNQEIQFIDDLTKKGVKQVVSNMKPGDVLMLENLRFYKGEEEDDENFAKKLASLADIFVQDAFACTHRKHASTYAIAKLLPNAIGFLIQNELEAFDKILVNPEKPFVAVLGGAKVKDKLPIIENILDKVDTIIIAGGMSYTFIKALDGEVGNSIVDESKIDYCKKVLNLAKQKGVKIELPCDNIATKEFSANAKIKKFNSGFLDKEYQGMDIGKKSIKKFCKILQSAKTILWNGPVGVYEFKKFRKGTTALAKCIAKSNAYSIIGGGDSVASVKDLHIEDRISHISTGGGASLELLQGKGLPGIEIINDK